MRRAMLIATLSILAAVVPSHAVTTGAVVASGNSYLPGDNSVGGTGVAVEVTHVRGNQLQFLNADIAPHTFTSTCSLVSCGAPANGTPRFGSNSVQQPGDTVDIARISQLPNGIYGFKCNVHSFMRGSLRITAA